MKLSDAIRRGAALGPQRFGNSPTVEPLIGWFGWLRTTPSPAYCAIEGARIAAGRNDHAWRGLDGFHCPACPVSGSAIDVVIHLNDEHAWTREAIADYVERAGG